MGFLSTFYDDIHPYINPVILSDRSTTPLTGRYMSSGRLIDFGAVCERRASGPDGRGFVVESRRRPSIPNATSGLGGNLIAEQRRSATIVLGREAAVRIVIRLAYEMRV